MDGLIGRISVKNSAYSAVTVRWRMTGNLKLSRIDYCGGLV